MTENQFADHRQWTGVDRTTEPEAFVRFLTAARSRALAAAKRGPNAAFADLDIREGQRVLDAACGLGDMTRLLARPPLALLASTIETAIAEGAVNETSARAWLRDVQARGEAGTFVGAFMLFRVSGTVPG